MLNQVVLVGRVVKEVELKETENAKKYSFITLAVPRSYKNMNGRYDTDFIECMLWDNVAKNVAEYCKKGDIIGVKGRLEVYQKEENDKKISQLHLVADKVTFLSQKREDNEHEVDER